MTGIAGKIAIVTGASSGLGWRFAEVLAEQGATVALAARRVGKLETLASELRAKGARCAVFAFDAMEKDAPDALFAAVEAELGTPDILINNAGVSLGGRAHELSADLFDQTMAINLRTPWRLSQICAARWMELGQEGCIVNLGSLLAKRVEKGMSVYCASKAALQHMTACHAMEWGKRGIRVNALCPGYIRTGINEDHWETGIGKAMIAKFPNKRLGVPSDLDNALLLLVDPANRFINGEALLVDDAQGWGI